jgi:hypothetical protein
MRFHPTVRRLQAVLAMAIGLMTALPAAALPDRSIGAVTASSATPWKGPADLSLDQMIGRKLVFLEKAPHEQAAGYPSFHLATVGQASDQPLPYRDFVGKRIQVVAIETAAAGELLVTARTTDGLTIQARTIAKALADVAPVGDYYQAKHRWLGKTIYTRKPSIQTYDAASSQYGELPVRVNEPLKVIDVIWGMSATKPLWVVVQRENGDKGFIATAFSWTNVYQDWWSMERPWEDKIAESTITQEMRALGLTSRMARASGNAADAENPY